MNAAGDTPEHQAVIDSLNAQIAELTQENLRLSSIIKPAVVIPSVVGLTKIEMRLVLFLLERSPHVMTYECIRLAIYGERAADMADEIIKVFVCKARKKLKPFGVKIDLHWCFGYAMPLDSACALRLLMAAAEA